MKLLGLTFHNDFRRIAEKEIVEEIDQNSRLSSSFLAMLAGSSIICTLGLLLDNAPIVIGGMIISPIIWPLTKLSLGISDGKLSYIRHALLLLALSVLVIFVLALGVALVSPIKVASSEILIRTTPTLLDIIVALIAGGVAAVAITHPRISSALAGVALATSITPPLCVAAVGLAFLRPGIFSGSMLLFAGNLAAILFAGIIVFSILGIERLTSSSLRQKGVLFSAGLLIAVTVPLFFLLGTYVFEANAFSEVEQVLDSELRQISRRAEVRNIRVVLQPRLRNVVSVEADVLLPEGVSIDFTQQNRIVASLQQTLDKNVDLRLRMQRTLSVISFSDQQLRKKEEQLRRALTDSVSSLSEDVEIASADISFDDGEKIWFVEVVLFSNFDDRLTINDRQFLEQQLAENVTDPVRLSLTVIPKLELLDSTDSAEIVFP